MQVLPIGVHDFAKIRKKNLLYVDKTAHLVNLIHNGEKYFLSRPRRFGKSLTVSTLASMFSGKYDLFKGLYAEEWVKNCANHPFPVLLFDMSDINKNDPEYIRRRLEDEIKRFAKIFNVKLESSTMEGKFIDLLDSIYQQYGEIVILIDEYDKPILDCIDNVKQADAVRKVLKGFYTLLKKCDTYIRFLFITGISKFSKTSIFSSMNNLEDISMDVQYADIVGYTQNELVKNFPEFINSTSSIMEITPDDVLNKLKNYYDGFCFDGETKVYNPFSIMLCLKKSKFMNYWYESGSPSFIVKYLKQHNISDLEQYEHIHVTDNFLDIHEIESASPENFLYQTGYLTIEKIEDSNFILRYPNAEVKESINTMYLSAIYNINEYNILGKSLWTSLQNGDMDETINIFNSALSSIPYDDFPKRDEYWYRSLFLMLLRGAGILSVAEAHGNKGRPDIIALLAKRIIVIEFKTCKNMRGLSKARREGKEQIEKNMYAESYKYENRQLTRSVIIVNIEKHMAFL